MEELSGKEHCLRPAKEALMGGLADHSLPVHSPVYLYWVKVRKEFTQWNIFVS